MKKIFSMVACAVIGMTMFAGCDIPGMNKNDDDEDIINYESQAENNAKSYSWLLEPTVSADNIISFDGSQINPNADNALSAYASYSVIRNNGIYGLIDYNGTVIAEPTYEDYYTSATGEVTLVNIKNQQAQEYDFCTVDSSNQVVKYAKVPEDNSPKYYWCSAENKIYVKNKNADTGKVYTGKKAVVVSEAVVSKSDKKDEFDITPSGNGYFGLAKNNKLILDMNYKDYYAPAYKGAGATAIAFQNADDKWGYVASDGHTIIDFIMEGDLNAYNGMFLDDPTKSHPYLFTGKYVPVLTSSASYGYYDIDGNCVVAPGEFEQARPVHNGRAWVRKNGLWGIIQLGEITKAPETQKTKKTTTTSVTSYQTWATTTGKATQKTSDSAATTKVNSQQQTTPAPTQAPEPIITDPPPTQAPEPIVTDPPTQAPEPVVTDPPAVEPNE